MYESCRPDQVFDIAWFRVFWIDVDELSLVAQQFVKHGLAFLKQ